MLTNSQSIVALDVGGRRIGVASANAEARIAYPLRTVINDEHVMDTLQRVFHDEDAAVLVIGLPRSLQGDSTHQTEAIERFVQRLKLSFTMPMFMQDEALTSRKAEEELQQRHVQYKKGDIDALAATYILEDFLQDHPEVKA